MQEQTESLITAVIVDDEAQSRAGLRSLLRSRPGWQVIEECADGGHAVDAIRSRHPDVVFLDIRMPKRDGLAVAEACREQEPAPAVVFATAHDEHAVKAFELEAVDYLLKPFDDQRFAQAAQRVEHAVRARRLLASGGPAETQALQRIVIRSIGRIQIVELADVQWLRASGNYVELHAPGKTYLYRETLSKLEQQLDPQQFVRIHRSIIVNRRSVRELRPLQGGDYEVALVDGERLRLSRSHRRALVRLRA
jgi:two-component system LytT family response regulator